MVGLEDAKRLRHEGFDVGEVVRRGSDGVQVEGVVLERKVESVADHPVGVRDSSLGRYPARLFEHLAREVEADDSPHVRGEREGRVAGARGDVEDEVARPGPGEVEDLLQAD